MIRRLYAAVVALALLAGGIRADEKQPPKPTGKEEARPAVLHIHIDLKDLPPDVLQKILELSKKNAAVKPGQGKEEPPTKKPGEEKKPGADKKPVSKTISLSEAVAIAEKVGKGVAVRAERKEEKNGFYYKVDVANKSGETAKIELSASGTIISERKETPPEKKPGKGDGDKEGEKGQKGENNDQKGEKKEK